MENYVNKIALVTGASSGIGAGIAKELTKRGCIVIGIARRLDKLQLLKEEIDQSTSATKGAFHSIQCDISDEQQLENAFDKIKTNYGIPSILVNNAGVTSRKKFEDMDGKTFDTVVNTNAKALLLATKLAVKLMSENSIVGHVVNVNSIAGHYLPLFEEAIVYSGSKHMTRVFTEGIREMIAEKKLNIKISVRKLNMERFKFLLLVLFDISVKSKQNHFTAVYPMNRKYDIENNISPGLVQTPILEGNPRFTNIQLTILSVDDVVKACIAILDTAPNVLISELTILPVHQSTKI